MLVGNPDLSLKSLTVLQAASEIWRVRRPRQARVAAGRSDFPSEEGHGGDSKRRQNDYNDQPCKRDPAYLIQATARGSDIGRGCDDGGVPFRPPAASVEDRTIAAPLPGTWLTDR